MSGPSVLSKTNSIHPTFVDENDAIKLFKRKKRSRFAATRVPSNRVPDETMNLEDTVFNMDTSAVLVIIGATKLLLLTPLLVLGVTLISMKTSKTSSFLSLNNNSETSLGATTTSTPLEVTTSTTDRLYDRFYKLRSDSVAPIATAAVIIVYMLVATISFVACILCIEYDRIEIQSIDLLLEKGFLELIVYRKLYMACVVFASVGVAIGILSMYVGSRMAELEQHRLYMERDGLPAVLTTKDGRLRRFVLAVTKRFQMSSYIDPDGPNSSIRIDSITVQNEETENDRPVSLSNHSNKDV